MCGGRVQDSVSAVTWVLPKRWVAVSALSDHHAGQAALAPTHDNFTIFALVVEAVATALSQIGFLNHVT